MAVPDIEPRIRVIDFLLIFEVRAFCGYTNLDIMCIRSAASNASSS